MKYDIPCQYCGAIVGTAEFPTELDKEELAFRLSGYVCEKPACQLKIPRIQTTEEVIEAIKADIAAMKAAPLPK